MLFRLIFEECFSCANKNLLWGGEKDFNPFLRAVFSCLTNWEVRNVTFYDIVSLYAVFRKIFTCGESEKISFCGVSKTNGLEIKYIIR